MTLKLALLNWYCTVRISNNSHTSRSYKLVMLAFVSANTLRHLFYFLKVVVVFVLTYRGV